MKISSLFNVIRNATDLAEYFDGVETSEQMVSQLERLKKSSSEEFLDDIKALKNSVSALLDDTMEMGRSIDDDEENQNPLDDEFSDLDEADDDFATFLQDADDKNEPTTEEKTEDVNEKETKI